MSERLIIKAGLLIDGDGGFGQGKVLVIKGTRIEEIIAINDYVEAAGDEIIDASSYTVMPGLIDCHVHTRSSGIPQERAGDSHQTTIPQFTLRALENAQKDLEAGFTTIRDLASIGYVDVALRDAIEQGRFIGPRMRVAGYGLTMWGGHMHQFFRPGIDAGGGIETGLVNTADEAKSSARYQIGRGVDFIKFNTAVSVLHENGVLDLQQEMDFDMLSAAVHEAKKVGVWTAAHCHGGQGATDTILAGVNTLEHGHWLTDQHFEMMLEQGTIFVPTLSPNEKLYELGPEGAGRSWNRWEWLEKVMVDKTDTLERAMKAGVPIAAGSDAGTGFNYHGENAREMEFLVRRGMTPMQAIVAATKTAAMATNILDETGTLEKGKRADVLVIQGNPLEDITILNNSKNILRVIQDGKIVVDRS